MSTMTVPKDDPLRHATAALTAAGIAVAETREIPHGWQIRGAGGEILNVYATGKAVAQGRNTAAVLAAFARSVPAANAVPTVPVSTPKPAPVKPAPTTAEPVDVSEHTPRRPANWSDRAWNGRDDDVPF